MWKDLSIREKADYIKLGVKNGITNLNLIRDTYNTYAKGGFKGGQSNPIELSEIIVTPEEWQKDFHKNFGTSKIRSQVLEDLNNAPIKSKYELPEFRPNTTLTSEEQELQRKRRTDLNRLQEKQSSGELLHERSRRLWRVWNDAGRPNLSSSYIIPTSYVDGKRRPHIYPIGKGYAYNIRNYKDVIAELSHPIERKYIPESDISRLFQTLLFSEENYNKPEQHEYRTHSVIQPLLEDYILNDKRLESNKATSSDKLGIEFLLKEKPWYLNKYEDGGYIEHWDESPEGIAANAAIGLIPVIGTVNEARQLYNNPSWEQLGWTGLSALGDLATIFTFGAGEGAKAAISTAKATRSLSKAKKAYDSAKAAAKAAEASKRAQRAYQADVNLVRLGPSVSRRSNMLRARANERLLSGPTTYLQRESTVLSNQERFNKITNWGTQGIQSGTELNN